MMGANPRSLPVLDGIVKPEGIDLVCTKGHPSEIFWRQLKFAEFDLSEMSMSSYLMYLAGGNRDWVGIPVFSQRRFFHTGIWIRNDRGIERPEDLKGKRVGVPEYQQTAALWTRGALQHEWGVTAQDIGEWFMERTEAVSHGGATGFQPPSGVKLTHMSADTNIGEMLLEGELDATILYIVDNNLVDRSKARLEDSPKMRLLFPNQVAEGHRYFQKTGIYPINHAMVVRRSIVEKHPWVVLNIYNAFTRAKEMYLKELRDLAGGHLETGLLPVEARKAIAQDPYPYGVKANRMVLETIAQYSHEQGLTPRNIKLEEVFAEPTLDL
jgi:4,5-dihydroxyphthalate decarboxylase